MDGPTRKTVYTYDGLNRVLTLTAYTGSNGGGTVETTTYQYDGAGRLTKAIYPDDGGTGAGTVEYSYTPVSRVSTRTDQKDVVTTYAYDGKVKEGKKVKGDGR